MYSSPVTRFELMIGQNNSNSSLNYVKPGTMVNEIIITSFVKDNTLLNLSDFNFCSCECSRDESSAEGH